MSTAEQLREVEPTLELEWREIAAAVFAAKGIKTGLWQFGVRLQFAGLTGNWQQEGSSSVSLPSALTGVAGLAVWAATEPGPMVFDAAAFLTKPQAATPRRRAAKKST